MSHSPPHDPSHDHASTGFDAIDPHGDTHHEHVIVPRRTLMAVLLTLLAFTVLTVGLSRGEVWAADYFDIEFPQWVNVAVVMSIATVKGLLVLLFFMQLKYDSKLNSIIFANCIIAVGLFLFFTTTDLGNRGVIYEWKQGEISLGGTGGVTRGAGEHKETVSGNVTKFAREKYLAKWGPEKFAAIQASVKHEHAHHAASNTANLTRAIKGATGALSTTAPASGHGHDAGAHGDSHAAPDAHAPAGDAHETPPDAAKADHPEAAPTGGH